MHERIQNAINEARNFWRPESYDLQIEAFENIVQQRGGSSATNRAHLAALRLVRQVLVLLFMQSVNDRLGPESPYINNPDLAQWGEVSPRVLKEAIDLLWYAPAAPRQRAARRKEYQYEHQPRYRESTGYYRSKRERAVPAQAKPSPVEAVPVASAPVEPRTVEPAPIEPALESPAPVDTLQNEPSRNEPPRIEDAQETVAREEGLTPRIVRGARREPRRFARQALAETARRHPTPIRALQARRAGGRINATRAQAQSFCRPSQTAKMFAVVHCKGQQAKQATVAPACGRKRPSVQRRVTGDRSTATPPLSPRVSLSTVVSGKLNRAEIGELFSPEHDPRVGLQVVAGAAP